MQLHTVVFSDISTKKETNGKAASGQLGHSNHIISLLARDLFLINQKPDHFVATPFLKPTEQQKS
jgi:hypothetical protein